MGYIKTDYRKYIIVDEPWMKIYMSAFNAENPEVIYIKAKGHVSSDRKKSNYRTEVDNAKKRFNNELKNLLSSHKRDFDVNMLTEFELSPTGLANNKSSTLRYEIFLKPLYDKPLPDYEDIIRNICVNIDDALLDELSIYNIKPNKTMKTSI